MDFDYNEEPSPPTIDEYGEPSPLRVTFCNRMSEDEYEEQTSDATQKALDDLYATMDANPALYKRVLQRRKREEMENGGLFSYLKAQALVFVGREEAFGVSTDECAAKISSMKTQMSKIYKYSEGLRETNGLKRSARLLDKRLRQSAVSKASSKAAADSSSSAAPTFAEVSTAVASRRHALAPPPPPLPPLYPKGVLAPRLKIQYKRKGDPPPRHLQDIPNSVAARHVLTARSRSSKPLSTLALQTSPQQKRAKRTPSPTAAQKRTIGAMPCPLVLETCPSPVKRALRSNPSTDTTNAADTENRHPVSYLLAADIVNRRKLLKPASRRSPGGTPALDKKPATDNITQASLFNIELVKKFRNARLQSPSPTHSSNSCNESLDSSGWLSPDLPTRQRSLRAHDH